MKERIRAIMESKGMTQQEFSQFLEMSPASLSSIFTGRTNPTLNVVESIKKKFDNINLDWLMFGNGSMFVTDENPDNSDSETTDSGYDIENVSTQNQNFGSSELQPKYTIQTESVRYGAGTGYNKGHNSMSENPHLSDMKIINNVRRKIKEIRVFYDDQTYESFVPKE